MKGFGIYVQNDLLEPKHIAAMGVSVWLYMWLLDKMTSIDELQVGKVLGGKPVKFEEIGPELGISHDTLTRWIKRLEKGRYITVIRTPVGISFRVHKAKKRFRKSAESLSADSDLHTRNNAESTHAQLRNHTRNNAESNIRQYSDNTVDSIAEPSAPPFVFEEYLKKMRSDKCAHIRFIAFFFSKKRLAFDSEEQVKVAIKRHVRAARDVVKFGEGAVNAAVKECERMEAEDGIKWTIETILKVLTK